MFQELQVDIQDHVTNVEYINRTGNELHTKSSGEKAVKLKSDLDKLNARWGDVSTAIDDRVDKLEASIEQLKQYQVSGILINKERMNFCEKKKNQEIYIFVQKQCGTQILFGAYLASEFLLIVWSSSFTSSKYESPIISFQNPGQNTHFVSR